MAALTMIDCCSASTESVRSLGVLDPARGDGGACSTRAHPVRPTRHLNMVTPRKHELLHGATNAGAAGKCPPRKRLLLVWVGA